MSPTSVSRAVLAAAIISLVPDVLLACRKGPFQSVRTDRTVFLMGRATADTMLAGAGQTVLASGTRKDATYGQVVAIEKLPAHARRMLPNGTTRVVLVPWDYASDCSPLPRNGSAAWVPSGTRGVFWAELRDQKDWANGMPTLDVHEPDATPYPHGPRFGLIPRGQASQRLSEDELFGLLDLFPTQRAIQENPDSAWAPLVEWARANPSRANAYPLDHVASTARIAIERGLVRRITPPGLGTYRFTLSIPGQQDRVFFGRTYAEAATAWGELGRPRTDNTPREPFGYHVLLSVDASGDSLETDCAGYRNIRKEAFLAYVNEPPAAIAGGQQWRGMLEFNLALRALPNDTAVLRLAQLRPRGTPGKLPDAPATFTEVSGAPFRMEETYEYQPGERVILKAERNSPVTVIPCTSR